MVGGHVEHGAAQHPGGAGVFGDGDRVGVEHPRPLAVLGVAHHVGNVLVQGAAPAHVEQLHTPADPEDRQAAGQRPGEQVHFGGVAARLHPGGVRAGRCAVAAGVDVPAPGQQQPVQAVHRPGDPGHGWQQEGDRPRGGHGVDVVLWQQGGGQLPGLAPAGVFGVGGDPDDGRHGSLPFQRCGCGVVVP